MLPIRGDGSADIGEQRQQALPLTLAANPQLRLIPRIDKGFTWARWLPWRSFYSYGLASHIERAAPAGRMTREFRASFGRYRDAPTKSSLISRELPVRLRMSASVGAGCRTSVMFRHPPHQKRSDNRLGSGNEGVNLVSVRRCVCNGCVFVASCRVARARGGSGESCSPNADRTRSRRGVGVRGHGFGCARGPFLLSPTSRRAREGRSRAGASKLAGQAPSARATIRAVVSRSCSGRSRNLAGRSNACWCRFTASEKAALKLRRRRPDRIRPRTPGIASTVRRYTAGSSSRGRKTPGSQARRRRSKVRAVWRT